VIKSIDTTYEMPTLSENYPVHNNYYLQLLYIIAYTATSMKDLFDKTDNQLIVDFIKDINFYHSL